MQTRFIKLVKDVDIWLTRSLIKFFIVHNIADLYREFCRNHSCKELGGIQLGMALVEVTCRNRQEPDMILHTEHLHLAR